MRFPKTLAVLFLVASLGVLAGCSEKAQPESQPADAADVTAASVLYACNCGDACTCSSVSTAAGKCGCGEDLKAFHPLMVDGDTALLCGCGGECTCTLADAEATTCGCGKAVKKVSLAGSGIYFCNCEDACSCNTFSTQPGQCKCGMALKSTT